MVTSRNLNGGANVTSVMEFWFAEYANLIIFNHQDSSIYFNYKDFSTG